MLIKNIIYLIIALHGGTNMVKIDLTNLRPVLQNEKYALYILSQIKDNLYLGIRLNKENNTQTRVNIQKLPKIRVVDIYYNDKMVHIR